MGRIRMELSMMKSDSYVALFDALIEEHSIRIPPKWRRSFKVTIN